MHQLKGEVTDIVNRLNSEWVNAIRNGEENDGIDLGDMFSKFSDLTKELDNKFIEATQRIKKSKGKDL